MEKKNTVLLTVIGLATLLVAVVGATFAYFTAQMKTSGETSDLTVKTADLGNTTFTFNSSAKTYKYLDYPGGIAVLGADAKLEKKSEDANVYTATYDLKITYTNPTATDMPWELYVLDSEDIDTNIDPQCGIQTQIADNDTYFWYSSDAASNSHSGTDYQGEENCTLKAEVTSALTADKLIAKGLLLKSQSNSATIDASSQVTAETGPITEKGTTLGGSGKTPFAGRSITSEIETKYYYLVIKYPNAKTAQTDSGVQIQVSLTSENVQSSVTANAGAGA